MENTRTETLAREVKQGAGEILCAASGYGPLLQRDYRAILAGASRSPEEVAGLVRARFPEFAPPQTAVFRVDKDSGAPLEVGDELDIRLALLGRCRVRVIHLDRYSLTLATLPGHPEAGRITFGAGRDDRGRITFRICSRTRASAWWKYAGFLLMGKQMQAKTWVRFIGRLAEACGGDVQDAVYVSTERIEETPADCGGRDEPTFICEVCD